MTLTPPAARGEPSHHKTEPIVSGRAALGLLLAVLAVNIGWVGWNRGEAGARSPLFVGARLDPFQLPVVLAQELLADPVIDDGRTAKVPPPAPCTSDGLAGGASAQPTLFIFFATWNAQSGDALQRIAGLKPRYEERGLRVLAISVEPGQRERVREYARRARFPFNVAVDDQGLAERFGARRLPHGLLVDAEGMVRAVFPGYGPLTDTAALTRALEKVLP